MSPLAPAAVLLLGAFLLPLIVLQLPSRWRNHQWLRSLSAPMVVGLAMLALLGVRLTFGVDTQGQGLELLSSWDFATAETVAALTIRADTLSLPFLLLTVLTLLAVTLTTPLKFPPSTQAEENIGDLAIWLALGASACLLFVSANGLTLIYAILAFDGLTMFYWLQREQRTLSIARLFLGLATVVGLTMANLIPATGVAPGGVWLGIILWLRLGLYPFIEAKVHSTERDPLGLAYLALSLGVGIYLATRTMTAPLPEFFTWLAMCLLILNGLLAWLLDQPLLFLTRLLLVETLLILLVSPIDQAVITAYTVGLILSLVVLWVTPRLGQPRLNETAWSWPYFPALAASLTLLGLPFSLGWLARVGLYTTLFNSAKTSSTLLLIILAEALALSSLWRYWLMLWHGDEVSERRSLVSVIAMVPFLIPGLAPLILSTITDTPLPPADFNQPANIWVVFSATLIMAIGLGYFRPRLVERLKISTATWTEWLGLDWVFGYSSKGLDHAGKLVLGIWAVVEGQHYVGWAIFAALVGILIIFLNSQS